MVWRSSDPGRGRGPGGAAGPGRPPGPERAAVLPGRGPARAQPAGGRALADGRGRGRASAVAAGWVHVLGGCGGPAPRPVGRGACRRPGHPGRPPARHRPPPAGGAAAGHAGRVAPAPGPGPGPTRWLAAGLGDGPGWRAVAYQAAKLPLAILATGLRRPLVGRRAGQPDLFVLVGPVPQPPARRHPRPGTGRHPVPGAAAQVATFPAPSPPWPSAWAWSWPRPG